MTDIRLELLEAVKRNGSITWVHDAGLGMAQLQHAFLDVSCHNDHGLTSVI